MIEKFNIYEHGFKHISNVIDESEKEVSEARDGDVIYYPTKFNNFNEHLMGGLYPSTYYCFAGRPGSGKSLFSNQIIFDVLELSKDRNIIILYWTFEMTGSRQVLRIGSRESKLTLKELRSINKRLSDVDFSRYKESIKKYKSFPIYFNEVPRDDEFIYKINESIHKSKPDIQIINVLDHSRLVRGSKFDGELQRLDRLSKTFVLCMKSFKSIIILLSQLNREIEKPERAKKQFIPQLTDIFGADSIAQDSDFVGIINRPFDMYGITAKYLGEDPKGLLALHIVKNRDGELGMIPFEANLKHFNLHERDKIIKVIQNKIETPDNNQ